MFDDMYRQYGAALQTAALRVLGNEDDAADCVHDVLLRFLQRSSAYRQERGALRTYLLVAVRNQAISRVRRTRRRDELDRLSTSGQPQDYELEVSDSVDLGRLRGALATLPPDQRAALELAYHGGLSNSEIAARLNVPLGTIKSRLALAMRKLAAAVR